MPNFNYVAIDMMGKQKKGTIEAADEEKAYSKIKADGLVPLEMQTENIWNKEISFQLRTNIKPRDLSVFCRQFASMIAAGVTIIDALGMLVEQTENKALSKALKEVQISINKGETMSEAMRRHDKVFPSMLVNMVAAGEASGSIENSFSRMALQFEKAAKLKGLVKKAAVYPIVVACVALLVIVVMLVFVIPKYTQMFDELDAKLPAITMLMVTMSNFIIHYWYLILAMVAGAVAAIRLFGKSEAGKIFFGRIAYKMPLFGKLTIKTASSQFARTLSTLLYSGIPMIEALDIVGNTITNAVFRRAILEAKEDVVKGIPLSEPLERCGLLPPMVYHMVKIGEETGDMEAMLERLADYYDEEVELTTQTVMAALEPLIIIVLAVIVGVLIYSVMAPMVQMYQNMDSL